MQHVFALFVAEPVCAPQPQTDIFNNLNLSFWEYMLPGTDAYR
jgi:hypothetical protein